MAQPASLTPKQQRFVDEYLKDSNATQAAIRAGFSAKTAGQAASRLLKDVKIASAVGERRSQVATEAGLTLESHLNALNELRNKAASAEQFSAAVSAEVSRGKASGFYVEKRELTGPGGGPVIVKIVREGRRRPT